MTSEPFGHSLLGTIHNMQSEEEVTPTKHVLPIFLKHKELINEDTIGFEIGEALSQQLNDPKEVLIVQSRRGYKGEILWRLHLKTDEARAKILEENLYISDTQVPVYDKNPQVTGGSETKKTRVTIRDLPSSVQDAQILEMLKTYNINPTSKLMQGFHRDREGKLSTFGNGDRFLYAEEEALQKLTVPWKVQVGNFMCRINYKGQITSQQNITKCKACFSEEHTAGHKDCKYYSKGNNCHAFLGKEQMLSNMYQCEIKMQGETFSSAEQAYQVHKAYKCSRPDVAAEMLQHKNPFQAKRIGKQLNTDKNWDSNKENITTMKNILMHKFQIHECRDALIATGESKIVEGNQYDRFWAAGLTCEEAEHTQPEAWPGRNKMGELLQEVRAEINKLLQEARPKQSEQPPRNTERNTTKVVPPATEIKKGNQKGQKDMAERRTRSCTRPEDAGRRSQTQPKMTECINKLVREARKKSQKDNPALTRTEDEGSTEGDPVSEDQADE